MAALFVKNNHVHVQLGNGTTGTSVINCTTVNKILAMYMYDTPSKSQNNDDDDDDDVISSGKDNDVDNDKEQSSKWYSQTHKLYMYSRGNKGLD